MPNLNGLYIFGDFMSGYVFLLSSNRNGNCNVITTCSLMKKYTDVFVLRLWISSQTFYSVFFSEATATSSITVRVASSAIKRHYRGQSVFV